MSKLVQFLHIALQISPCSPLQSSPDKSTGSVNKDPPSPHHVRSWVKLSMVKYTKYNVRCFSVM